MYLRILLCTFFFSSATFADMVSAIKGTWASKCLATDYSNDVTKNTLWPSTKKIYIFDGKHIVYRNISYGQANCTDPVEESVSAWGYSINSSNQKLTQTFLQSKKKILNIYVLRTTNGNSDCDSGYKLNEFMDTTLCTKKIFEQAKISSTIVDVPISISGPDQLHIGDEVLYRILTDDPI